MKLMIRSLSLFLGLILVASAWGYFFWYKPKFSPTTKAHSFNTRAADGHASTILRIKQKASILEEYAKTNKYNEHYCFLVDIKINPGKKRFFVYNLQKDSVELAGLVTHGSGSGSSGDEPKCSNIPGSNCTSLGKYKIGHSYVGKFGPAYKLYGLDQTNSRAFERFVVLHAHECVPEDEVYPLTICRSLGCPTVSPEFLKSLKKYIDASEKPILLNIYK
jgi:hypothetical protein